MITRYYGQNSETLRQKVVMKYCVMVFYKDYMCTTAQGGGGGGGGTNCKHI